MWHVLLTCVLVPSGSLRTRFAQDAESLRVKRQLRQACALWLRCLTLLPAGEGTHAQRMDCFRALGETHLANALYGAALADLGESLVHCQALLAQSAAEADAQAEAEADADAAEADAAGAAPGGRRKGSNTGARRRPSAEREKAGGGSRGSRGLSRTLAALLTGVARAHIGRGQAADFPAALAALRRAQQAAEHANGPGGGAEGDDATALTVRALVRSGDEASAIPLAQALLGRNESHALGTLEFALLADGRGKRPEAIGALLQLLIADTSNKEVGRRE